MQSQVVFLLCFPFHAKFTGRYSKIQSDHRFKKNAKTKRAYSKLLAKWLIPHLFPSLHILLLDFGVDFCIF